MTLDLTTLVVADYDTAIDFFVGKLDFDLVEDKADISSRTKEPKRWVVVAPSGGGCRLLLARASNAAERAAIGNQTGGRVAFFLKTDDFARDHAKFAARGVVFRQEPRQEPYGTVAVFEDICGNLWDLIGPPVPQLSS